MSFVEDFDIEMSNFYVSCRQKFGIDFQGFLDMLHGFLIYHDHFKERERGILCPECKYGIIERKDNKIVCEFCDATFSVRADFRNTHDQLFASAIMHHLTIGDIPPNEREELKKLARGER